MSMEEKGIPLPKFITKSKEEPDSMRNNDVSDCVNNNCNESGKNWVNIAFGRSEEEVGVEKAPEVNANEIISPSEGVEKKISTKMEESQDEENERKIDGSQDLEDKYPKTTGGLLDAEVAKGVPVFDPSPLSQKVVRGGGETHIVVSGIRNTATGLCGNYWTSSPGGRRKSQPPEILQVELSTNFTIFTIFRESSYLGSPPSVVVVKHGDSTRNCLQS